MSSSPARGISMTGRAWRTLRRDRLAMVALGIIIAYSLLALVVWMGLLAEGYDRPDLDAIAAGPSWQHLLGTDARGCDRLKQSLAATGAWRLIAGYNTPDYTLSNQPPSRLHWLGTDVLGRDVFKRMLVGARIAMSVGLITSVIAIPIGVFLGALAGYFGGRLDELIVWMYSSLESVPGLLLIMSLSLVLGRGLTAIYVAIGVTTWVGLCRLMRGEFMRQRSLDYALAARAAGAGHLRIIFRQILPNTLHLVIINLSLRFVSAIQTEVILSYLGIGVQELPSWGLMIMDGQKELIGGNHWWELAAPAGAMFFIIYAFNVFGDALRNALDPRMSS
jgi:ABC-type dipeptide/oligopeptide/nickel transport system permease subunit